MLKEPCPVCGGRASSDLKRTWWQVLMRYPSMGCLKCSSERKDTQLASDASKKLTEKYGFEITVLPRSKHWECEKCGKINEKAATVGEFGIYMNVQAKIACPGCGTEYSRDMIYDYQMYDVREVRFNCPGCNAQLEGPNDWVLGKKCPTCGRWLIAQEEKVIAKVACPKCGARVGELCFINPKLLAAYPRSPTLHEERLELYWLVK
jgi:hypothetical protein